MSGINSNKLSNLSCNLKKSVTTSIKETGLINIWYTNADVLTQAKIHELKEEIITSDVHPDIIAITEIKPKNYVRELTEKEYEIDGYKFEHENLEEKNSTRGVGIYVNESLNFSKVMTNKIIDPNEDAPREVISIELRLEGKERMLFSNIYRNPSSDGRANVNINNFFQKIGSAKYDDKVIVGDFNRKEIKWHDVTYSSEDDTAFIEATRDSFLTQHILQPTRGRGTNEPSLLDLFFSSNEESVENIEFHSPLGKSDHSLIKVTYRSQPEKLPIKKICEYHKADFQMMKEMLDID